MSASKHCVSLGSQRSIVAHLTPVQNDPHIGLVKAHKRVRWLVQGCLVGLIALWPKALQIAPSSAPDTRERDKLALVGLIQALEDRPTLLHPWHRSTARSSEASGTLDSPCGVLCSFRSHYLFAIGSRSVCSLGSDPRPSFKLQSQAARLLETTGDSFRPDRVIYGTITLRCVSFQRTLVDPLLALRFQPFFLLPTSLG